MVSRRKSIETLQKGTVLDTPQIVPGRNPRTSPPPKLGVNVIKPVLLMTEVYADLEMRNASETVHRINDVINVQGHTARTSPSPAEALALNVKNVNEFNVPMDEVHEDLNAAKLLSEINEHMTVLIDTYGRTTGMRTPPIEALALRMMIVYETDVPTDDIIKGNEPAIMSMIGNLTDLEQVVSRCTTSTTSTTSTASTVLVCLTKNRSTVSTTANGVS